MIFDAAVVAGLSFPRLCDLLVIRRFVSSEIVRCVRVASPPLEIVQCLRENDSCRDDLAGIKLPAFLFPVSSFRFLFTPLFVVSVVGALASPDAG